MKKLSKLKLNALSEANLRDREMNELRGGDRNCSCSCYWENQGGSSSNANRNANHNSGSYGTYSTNGCNDYIYNDSDGGPAYCPGCKDTIMKDEWY
jgi:natural product precursor